jgi:hypothetical protein
MYLSHMAWVHIVLTVSCGYTGSTATTLKHTLPQMVTLQALAAEHKLQQKGVLATVTLCVLNESYYVQWITVNLWYNANLNFSFM